MLQLVPPNLIWVGLLYYWSVKVEAGGRYLCILDIVQELPGRYNHPPT